MKLDAAVTRIRRPVVAHDPNTQYVADRFDSSRRRVVKLTKAYREPPSKSPSWRPMVGPPTPEYPADLVDRYLELNDLHERGAAARTHVLPVSDGIAIGHNRVHAVLHEYEHETEHPR